MAFSWSEMQTEFQEQAIDVSTAALTSGKRSMNVGIKMLQADLGIWWNEVTRTGTTAASTNTITLPENLTRVKHFYVTIGDIRYSAEEVYTEDDWQRLLSNTAGQSNDQVSHMFRRQTILEIYPTPTATAGVTYTLTYESENKDLVDNDEDYIEGSILTLANGGTTVTGNAPSWADRIL